jgi:hypothetical protein
MNDTQNEILVSEDLAVLCKCTARTIEEHARSGNIPGLKLGEPWIFPRSAVIARLNELALLQAAVRRSGTGTPPAPGGVLVSTTIEAPKHSGRKRQPRPNLDNLTATSAVGGNA